MRNSTKIFILTLFIINIVMLFFFINTVSSKSRSTNSNISSINKDLSNTIDSFRKNNKFNGSILIAKDKDILLNMQYGIADYENNIIIDRNSTFEIASLTKQFTSLGILMLEEKGLLNLNDTISKYIPQFPNGNKITIYNLLTHTSGLNDLSNIEDYYSFIGEKLSYIPSELIQIVIDTNTTLSSEPGEKYRYADANYFLLGAIISKISGLSYEDFITRNIFEPLNMKNTGFIHINKVPPNLAYAYKLSTLKSDTPKKIPTWYNAYFHSAGGIYSTTEDLFKWCTSLYEAKLVKQLTLDKMFTPYLNNYALGVFVSKSVDGNKKVSHTGSLPGYGSVLTISFPKKYTIIFLYSHDSNSNFTKLTDKLLNILNKSYF